MLCLDIKNRARLNRTFEAVIDRVFEWFAQSSGSAWRSPERRQAECYHKLEDMWHRGDRNRASSACSKSLYPVYCRFCRGRCWMYNYLRVHCVLFSVDKKPTRCHFCVILYFSVTSCSTCFGQSCAHLQELMTV
jgi:hypothetical protein